MNLELSAEWINPLIAILISLGFLAVLVVLGLTVYPKISKDSTKIKWITLSVSSLLLLSITSLALSFVQMHQTYRGLIAAVTAQAEEVYGVELNEQAVKQLINGRNNVLSFANIRTEITADTLYGKTESFVDGNIATIRLAFYDGEFVLLDAGSQDAVELERVQ